MLVYTIIFGLLCVMFFYNDIENEYHVAYIAWSGIAFIIVFVGNLIYSLNRATPLIRKIWKVIFPVVVLDFIVGEVIDSNFGAHAHAMPSLVDVLKWIIGFALFFPSFRAHYLLGYKRTPTKPCTATECADSIKQENMTTPQIIILKAFVCLELLAFFVPVLAWPFLAKMSGHLFDKPIPGTGSLVFVLTLLIWGYPVLYFFSAFKTYKKLKEKNNLTALMYASLPILAFAAFALCMAAIWFIATK